MRSSGLTHAGVGRAGGAGGGGGGGSGVGVGNANASNGFASAWARSQRRRGESLDGEDMFHV